MRFDGAAGFEAVHSSQEKRHYFIGNNRTLRKDFIAEGTRPSSKKQPHLFRSRRLFANQMENPLQQRNFKMDTTLRTSESNGTQVRFYLSRTESYPQFSHLLTQSMRSTTLRQLGLLASEMDWERRKNNPQLQAASSTQYVHDWLCCFWERCLLSP